MLDAARLAELTGDTASTATDSTIILDQIAKLKSEIRRIGRDRERDRVNAAQPSRSPTPESRHVTFNADAADTTRLPDRAYYNRSASPSGVGRY